MGILDDAIRQHLELKRQHGASEEEVQRQEEEALGPARRDVAPPEPAGEEAEAVAEEAAEPEAASEHEMELYEPTPVESDTAAEPETAFEPEPDTAFEAERETGFDGEPDTAFESELEDDRAPADEPEVQAVPEPEDLPPSPAPFDASTAFEDFAEDEQEPEGPEEPEGAEGDVLEDTPDFLQETPEHDRLWFEQRPPRDFDFD